MTVRRKRAISLRSVGLLLSLSLALPNPAWALRTQSPDEVAETRSGLEEKMGGLKEDWVILEPGHAEYDRIFVAGRELLYIFASEELIGYLSSLPEGVGVVFRVMPRSAAEAEELEGEWGLSPLRSGWDRVFRLKGHPVLPKLLLEREEEPGEGAEVLEFTLNGGDVLRVVSPDSATFEGSASLPAGFKEEVSRYRSGSLKGPEDLKWVGKVVQYLEQGRLQIRRLEGVAYGLPGQVSTKGRFIEQTGLSAERVLTEDEFEQRRAARASRERAERREKITAPLLQDAELKGRLERIKRLADDLDGGIDALVQVDPKQVRKIRASIGAASLDPIVGREVAVGGDLAAVRARVIQRLEKEEGIIRSGILSLTERGGPMAQVLRRLTRALAAQGWKDSLPVLKDLDRLLQDVMRGKAVLADREWQKLRDTLRVLILKADRSPIAEVGTQVAVESSVAAIAFLLMLLERITAEEVELLLGPKWGEGTLWFWMSSFPWMLDPSGSDKRLWQLRALQGSKRDAHGVWQDVLSLLMEVQVTSAGGSPLLEGVLQDASRDELGDLMIQLVAEMGPIPAHLSRGLLMRQEPAILNLYAVCEELGAQASHRLGRRHQAIELLQDAERFYTLAWRLKPGTRISWRPSFKETIPVPWTELEEHLNALSELIDARQWSGIRTLWEEFPNIQGRMLVHPIGAVQVHALVLQEQLVRRIMALPTEALPVNPEDRQALEGWTAFSVMILMLTDQLPPDVAWAYVQQDWAVTRELWALLAQFLLDATVQRYASDRLGLEGLSRKYPALREEGRREWGVWQDAAMSFPPMVVQREEGRREWGVWQDAATAFIGVQRVETAVGRIAEELVERKDLQRDFLLRKEAAVVNLAAVFSEIQALLAKESGDLGKSQKFQELANRRYELISTQIDPSYPVWRPSQTSPSAQLGAGLEEGPSDQEIADTLTEVQGTAEQRAAALERLRQWILIPLRKIPEKRFMEGEFGGYLQIMRQAMTMAETRLNELHLQRPGLDIVQRLLPALEARTVNVPGLWEAGLGQILDEWTRLTGGWTLAVATEWMKHWADDVGPRRKEPFDQHTARLKGESGTEHLEAVIEEVEVLLRRLPEWNNALQEWTSETEVAFGKIDAIRNRVKPVEGAPVSASGPRSDALSRGQRGEAAQRLRAWLEGAAQAPSEAVVAIGPERVRQYETALRAIAGLMPSPLRERIFLVTHTATEAKEIWEPRGLFASNDTVLVAQELQRRFGAEAVSRSLFYHATPGQAQALQDTLTLWELEKRFQVVLREQSADLRQFLQELLANLRGVTAEQLSDDVTFQQVVSDAELLAGA